MDKKIFWLASYPKSGNTLLRYILTALFFTEDGKFTFDKSEFVSLFDHTLLVNKNKEIFGDEYNKLGDIKIFYKYLYQLQSKSSLNIKGDFIFFKTHAGLFKIKSNAFTSMNNTRGIIYLIRDPRDISISMARINGVMRIPFRDPHLMPSGKIAVVTGGHRWGCPVGNICEIEISNASMKICRETILGGSMLRFKEIERPTFIDDLMFFSVNGSSPILHVAKLGKDNLYAYHSEVEDSRGCYGPAIDKNFRLLYWNKGDFTINRVPEKSNLSYQSGAWRLIRDANVYQPSSSAIAAFFLNYQQ